MELFDTTFELEIGNLIDIRRKRDKTYNANSNMVSFLKAKHDKHGLVKMFTWFADVCIEIGENTVIVRAPNEFIREHIQRNYSFMLAAHYTATVRIV